MMPNKKCSQQAVASELHLLLYAMVLAPDAQLGFKSVGRSWLCGKAATLSKNPFRIDTYLQLGGAAGLDWGWASTQCYQRLAFWRGSAGR